MIVTKKALSRRTVLRGLGVSLALPLLDSMVPAFAAAPSPIRRFSAVYVPNGFEMSRWTPAAEGAGFEFTATLKPLEAYRDRLLVVSGLNVARNAGTSVHSRASTRWLTGVPPKEGQTASVLAGVSMDQIAAKAIGQETQLASMELSLEPSDFAGACDPGFSCAYTSTISWRSETTPLPMEHNPRAAFERLFGDGGSTDPAARLARSKRDRSLLDSVVEEANRLNRTIGAGDRLKMNEYLEAVRDVERRIQKAAEQNDQELPPMNQPTEVPVSYEQYARLMFDLQVLAYQTDRTRIATFMMGRELSGRQYYQETGVPDAHHPISHHGGDSEKLAGYALINAFHTRLFSYYLGRLKETPDGDASLLDRMVVLYGSGMSDGNSHSPNDLPVVLAGGGIGRGGRHLKFSKETPLPNLHLTLLDWLGVPVEKLGDSTGALSLA
jgi:hypothetical protein